MPYLYQQLPPEYVEEYPGGHLLAFKSNANPHPRSCPARALYIRGRNRTVGPILCQSMLEYGNDQRCCSRSVSPAKYVRRVQQRDSNTRFNTSCIDSLTTSTCDSTASQPSRGSASQHMLCSCEVLFFYDATFHFRSLGSLGPDSRPLFVNVTVY